MDCVVHGVTKSQTRLSDFHFFSQRKKENRSKERALAGVLFARC